MHHNTRIKSIPNAHKDANKHSCLMIVGLQNHQLWTTGGPPSSSSLNSVQCRPPKNNNCIPSGKPELIMHIEIIIAVSAPARGPKREGDYVEVNKIVVDMQTSNSRKKNPLNNE